LLGGKGWRAGVVNLAVLASVLRTTEKGHQLLRKKSVGLPSEKILATPMSPMGTSGRRCLWDTREKISCLIFIKCI